MSVEDVRIGLAQMFQEAADRSTPTGRSLADRLAIVVWGYKNMNVPTGEKDTYFHLLNPKSGGATSVDVKALAVEVAKLIPAPAWDYAKLANEVADELDRRELKRITQVKDA